MWLNKCFLVSHLADELLDDSRENMITITAILEDTQIVAVHNTDTGLFTVLVGDGSTGQQQVINDVTGEALAASLAIAVHPNGEFESAVNEDDVKFNVNEHLYDLAKPLTSKLPKALRIIP